MRYLAEEHDVGCDDAEVDVHCATNKGHVDVVKYLLEEQQVDEKALVNNVVDQNALQYTRLLIRANLRLSFAVYIHNFV